MIAIVDYRAGNLTSVRLAFEAIGAKAAPTSDPAAIRAAERIVFPGVGAAGSAMANLGELGLAPVLRERVAAGVPFLGICLGTQILLDRSEEDGGVACLGLLRGEARLAYLRLERVGMLLVFALLWFPQTGRFLGAMLRGFLRLFGMEEPFG